MNQPLCPVCGYAGHYVHTDVLWPTLIEEWNLSADEADYVNRQQGTHCPRCGCNLRCVALAVAIMNHYRWPQTFHQFAVSSQLKLLEINPCGALTRFLAAMPSRTLASYPTVDMQRMPYADGSFDLVVHSDTLEHVPDPVLGLSECRRVLRPGGACAFTIPIIVGRMSRTRDGLPASYHDREGTTDQGQRVRTEFGADAWTYALRAGFSSVQTVTLDYPAAHALICTTV
jgi:SAM-dependent methyltransferase